MYHEVPKGTNLPGHSIQIKVELSRRRQKAPSKEQPQTFSELSWLSFDITTTKLRRRKMRKKWKMRGGIVLLLGVFILSIGSVSWAKATSGKLYCYSSPPQIKSQKKEIRSKNQRGKIQYEKKLNLNLTPEQRVKLTRLRLSFQEQTIDLRSALAKKIIELQKLWLKKTPNRVKMYSLCLLYTSPSPRDS